MIKTFNKIVGNKEYYKLFEFYFSVDFFDWRKDVVYNWKEFSFIDITYTFYKSEEDKEYEYRLYFNLLGFNFQFSFGKRDKDYLKVFTAE